VPSIDEILEEMRANPKALRFADACKVATHIFGPPRQNGTSHKVWKMPWPGDPRVNMQAGEGGNAKASQVRQVVLAVEQLLGQRAQKTVAVKPVVETSSKARRRR